MRLAMVLWPGYSPDQAAIAEHGSGKALAVHLGITSSNPARWISDHRRRIKNPWNPETRASLRGAFFVSIGLAVDTDASPVRTSTELQI
ncbi:hypothetical protein SynNOUM97013_02473 [Synechococcus sp. NOUM97013]|nr:hypothetical protein SynNOUM97013_02473 [Synechococcus sp. NOUM97013]